MDIVKKISDNPKLVALCNKILTYNAILDTDESRYLFLASLISAETLIDKESCLETLETANFIMNHMDFFQLEDNVRKEIDIYIKKAIDIASKELEEFNNKEKK